jgi:serine/threonine protein kinase
MSTSTFGHYRIDARIGQGGMGDVFRAFDTRLKRPVALKLMRNTGEGGGGIPLVDRFLREARAASALNHPNIVVIHEVGETPEGERYIVQEFIEGRTLRSMLTGPMAVEAVVDIGSQIAQALAAAHASGIVHRDVKPENVMIRADGYVKVLDFGLARLTEVAGSEITTHTNLETAAGVLIGTPAYMSPEQALGRPPGPPVDIFSLGVVLYEMAAGRRPFDAPTSLALISSIVSQQPVPLGTLNPSMPRALADLIARMLEKSPEQRPSASEVEELLSGLLRQDAPVGLAPGRAKAERITVGREAQRVSV